jgi:vesicle-fusing ATPase
MTNRRDLLEPALLRPGRLEVGVYVPLPDEIGRAQILDIHMRAARESGLVDNTVVTTDLASRSEGFSGADIAGLVRSATSFAVARWQHDREQQLSNNKSSTSAGTSSTSNSDSSSSSERETAPLMLTLSDFEQALQEVKPSVAAAGDRASRNPLRRLSRAVVDRIGLGS